MALQTSGAISMSNIQSEFGGGNPISINNYYRGGARVPNSSVNSSIPTSGTISLSNFYGGASATADNTFNFTMGLGSTGGKYAMNVYGASNSASYLGNISNGAVTTNNLAVSETITDFTLTQGLGYLLGCSMGTSASGGGERLWTQGAVRGFNLNGTNYSFASPTSGARVLTMQGIAGGNAASPPAIENQMASLVGSACTVTLTY